MSFFDIASYMLTYRAGNENGTPGSRPSQWRGARRAAVGVKTWQAPLEEDDDAAPASRHGMIMRRAIVVARMMQCGV